MQLTQEIIDRVQAEYDQIAASEKEEIQAWLRGSGNAALRKGKVTQGELEHIVDYLLLSDEAPRRLRRLSIDDAKRKADEWVAAKNKKAQGIVETDEDTEVVKTWDDGFRLLKLRGEAAYKREGVLMGHCVGSSDHYRNQSDAGKIDILSLRDKKNDPHATFEISRAGNGEVRQIKGKGNGEIHARYIGKVLEVLRELGLKISAHEMTYLGYVEYTDQMQRLFYKFDGIKEITYAGTRFMWKGSKLSYKKGMEPTPEKVAEIREAIARGR